MELGELAEQIKNSIKTKRINENEYKIQTNFIFSDETKLDLFLMRSKDGTTILTDKKKTLTYMSEFYEIESKDVKKSIKDITDIYDITRYQNALVYKLKSTDDIVTTYIEFLSCVAQLVNMFVFFKNPDEE